MDFGSILWGHVIRRVVLYASIYGGLQYGALCPNKFLMTEIRLCGLHFGVLITFHITCSFILFARFHMSDAVNRIGWNVVGIFRVNPRFYTAIQV